MYDVNGCCSHRIVDISNADFLPQPLDRSHQLTRLSTVAWRRWMFERGGTDRAGEAVQLAAAAVPLSPPAAAHL